MFDGLDSGMQRLWRIAAEHRHRVLCDDVAMVDLLIDEVNRDPSDLLAGDESLFPCLESWKLWQERGVNINDSPRECAEHLLL